MLWKFILDAVTRLDPIRRRLLLAFPLVNNFLYGLLSDMTLYIVFNKNYIAMIFEALCGVYIDVPAPCAFLEGPEKGVALGIIWIGEYLNRRAEHTIRGQDDAKSLCA